MLNEIIDFLDKNFSEEKVAEMFDEELLEWVDADWSDDYDSEYDWYIDHNNGEAEAEVIRSIIMFIKSAFPTIDESIDLDDVIREKYEILNK
jgi:hypothetical protein